MVATADSSLTDLPSDPAAGSDPVADEFLAPALDIGRRIAAEATVAPDGGLTWGRGAGHSQQPVPDSGPFNGRVGEALLFAGLHAVTGDAEWRRLCGRVVAPLLDRAGDPPALEELADEISLGLCGTAGIAYCLLRIAELTGLEGAREAAAAYGRLFTPERIAGDYRHDVIWGNAGVLLALLALADAGEEWALAPAAACAEHLLDARAVDPTSGKRAWRTLRAVPSASFAHGASGIAHALLELHRRRPDERLYRAALEAFDFERTLYREELDYWDDSHAEPDDAPRMWSWCHGAPGIVLARLSALGLASGEDDRAVAADLMVALKSTLGARVPGVDTICCGYFGRIDVVHQAGLRLDNPSLRLNAEQLARQRLHRASVKGGMLLNDIDESVEGHLHPGLWQGLGGSAYTLLRLAAPGRLPCILSME